MEGHHHFNVEGENVRRLALQRKFEQEQASKAHPRTLVDWLMNPGEFGAPVQTVETTPPEAKDDTPVTTEEVS